MTRILFLYPFLLAIYPVVFIFSRNVNYFNLVDTLPYIAASMLVALCVLFLSKIILKSYHKYVFFSALFVIYFYSSGMITILIRGHFNAKYALVAFVSLSVISLYLIHRSKASIAKVNKILCFSTIFILVLPTYTSAKKIWEIKSAKEMSMLSGEGDHRSTGNTNKLPDVFYILLDEYSRHDVLKTVFNYDNEWFIRSLEKRGFFVPKDACSNYHTTCCSMACVFNFSYLDEITSKYEGLELSTENDKSHYYDAVHNNKLFPILRKAGYSVIMYKSTWPVTNFTNNVDTIIDPEYVDEYEISLFNFDFYSLLLSKTPIDIFKFNNLKSKNEYFHAQRVNHIFKKLGLLMSEPPSSPRFVYTHIVCPHEPFVFDRNGYLPYTPEAHNEVSLTSNEYKKLYADQTHAINNKVLSLLDETLPKLDPNNTLIIIQSDHGFRPQRGVKLPENTALRNLNAYYTPKKYSEHLYANISQVNTFRIFLTQYLDFDLPSLPDRSYNEGRSLYDLIEVTDELKNY